MAEGPSMASLSLYILTFNCAHEPIDTPAFASQLFNGLDDSVLPDLLVISLQEISPLAQSFLTPSFLDPYFSRIQDAVDIAVRDLAGDSPARFTRLVVHHIGMTAIMVFAKDPAAIESFETAEMGLGAKEMGNKGAVGVRLVYRDINGSSNSFTEMTFVAAHLAAMEPALERRNEDWKNIVRGLVFSSSSPERKGSSTSLSGGAAGDDGPLLAGVGRESGIYKATSHLFLAGDLNYRTSVIKPSLTDHRDSFPQPHHDEDHPQHHFNLFENDQLNQEREAGRTCHGMVEAPITFPPTYKYNGDEPFLVPDDSISHWSWATHRWPSWCDRILFLQVPPWLTRQYPQAKIITHRYVALPLFSTSDHRGVALQFTVPLVPIPQPDEDEDSDDPRLNPPYDINPEWKADREKARRLELISGSSMYMTGTWKGWGIMLAVATGIFGGLFMIKALMDL